MRRRKRKSRPWEPALEPAVRGGREKLLGTLLAGAVVITVGVGVCLCLLRDDQPPIGSNRSIPTADAVVKVARTAESLDELLKLPPRRLARAEIAEMKLLCAAGLPGAEDLDINGCLARLDDWAAYVKRETDRHLYKFGRNPIEYNNSPAYFRMLTLVSVLQQDLGVHYNQQRIRDVDFTRSEDLFIHGMIAGDNGGRYVT